MLSHHPQNIVTQQTGKLFPLKILHFLIELESTTLHKYFQLPQLYHNHTQMWHIWASCLEELSRLAWKLKNCVKWQSLVLWGINKKKFWGGTFACFISVKLFNFFLFSFALPLTRTDRLDTHISRLPLRHNKVLKIKWKTL